VPAQHKVHIEDQSLPPGQSAVEVIVQKVYGFFARHAKANLASIISTSATA